MRNPFRLCMSLFDTIFVQVNLATEIFRTLSPWIKPVDSVNYLILQRRFSRLVSRNSILMFVYSRFCEKIDLLRSVLFPRLQSYSSKECSQPQYTFNNKSVSLCHLSNYHFFVILSSIIIRYTRTNY